jgi:hypothetical protein
MQPPLRTAEIHAYNFGRQTRAAGLDLAALTPPGMAWAVIPYNADTERAESELGPSGFASWAVRGWLESI